MNKVVCYVCGTSYPENAPQCPICGYVQTADKSASANSGESTYTYVKGGRFSKANVKKRNQVKQSAGKPVAVNKNVQHKKAKNSNTGMIILIAVLLLAIIAVIGYITLRFFLPNDFIFEGLDNLRLPSASQEDINNVPEEPEVTDNPPASEPEETATLECKSVVLDTDTVQLTAVDETYDLVVTLDPVETADAISYSSNNESVAVVSQTGTITCVGEGTAVITVTCGSATAECTVICVIETEPADLVLNRKEITFNAEGQTWLLYDGDIPVEDIIWSSDDNKIATILDGKVVAISNGDTTVYGSYNDQTVECVIHCNFDDEIEEGTGNVSEAGGDSEMVYTLFNPYGYADDVTLNPGEKFILKLVDDNKEEIDDAQWSVSNSNVCTFSNNTVTALGSGYCEVTATFEGKTYTCIVRVN